MPPCTPSPGARVTPEGSLRAFWSIFHHFDKLTLPPRARSQILRAVYASNQELPCGCEHFRSLYWCLRGIFETERREGARARETLMAGWQVQSSGSVPSSGHALVTARCHAQNLSSRWSSNQLSSMLPDSCIRIRSAETHQPCLKLPYYREVNIVLYLLPRLNAT